MQHGRRLRALDQGRKIQNPYTFKCSSHLFLPMSRKKDFCDKDLNITSK